MPGALRIAQTRRVRLSLPSLTHLAQGQWGQARGHPEEVSEPCLKPGSSAPARKGFARWSEGTVP